VKSLDFLVFTLSLSKGVSRQKHIKLSCGKQADEQLKVKM